MTINVNLRQIKADFDGQVDLMPANDVCPNHKRPLEFGSGEFV